MQNLKDILKGKVVILCIGNKDRGDDGIGPYIANEIKGRVPYEVIDAGVTPENHTAVISRLKPDTIIIIDAIQFEGNPGEVRLFSEAQIRSGNISTHDVSPKLFIEYLHSSTKAKIYILGVKPKSNKLGDGLSSEVLSAVNALKRDFKTQDEGCPLGGRLHLDNI